MGGDPVGRRKYVRCSLRRLASQLKSASPMTVRRLLKEMGFSLRANVKRLSGPPHPDRDLQFRYIQRQKRKFLKAGQPVISVDTKNTELIGNFKNSGTLWRQKADEVSVYDFPGDAECRAIPYGVYDVPHKRGHVSVGTSADTPQFAVHSIREWWNHTGSKQHPDARELLITADSGGSNLPAENLPSDHGDGTTTDTCAARSRHPGGVQTLMADGAVQFTSESISLGVWRAMATIDGGEIPAPY